MDGYVSTIPDSGVQGLAGSPGPGIFLSDNPGPSVDEIEALLPVPNDGDDSVPGLSERDSL